MHKQEHSRLDLTDLTKLSLGIGSGDGRRNDNVVTGEPVDGASDTVLVGGLEGINDTQNLGGVTASGGRVGHDQTDLLGRVNDEDGADGQSHALGVDVGGVLEVNHVVEVGNLALRVGDDGELEVGASDLIDVLNPAVVGLDLVGTQTDELDTTLGELGLKLGKGTELGGTDGGEVIGVGEEDGPLSTEELVEVDGTVRGVRVEVRGSRAQTETIDDELLATTFHKLETILTYFRGIYYKSRGARHQREGKYTYGARCSAIVIEGREDN